jgi:uncharacterized protein YndB with AHSA1/START domain
MADDVIRIERRIAAPPSAVFRYLTDANLWPRWQGVGADLDPVPGGRFEVRMPVGATVVGSFMQVEPDQLVVITWGWVGDATMPPGTSTVEFELLPDGDGTLLRLTHRGIPDSHLPLHRDGWAMYVPRLIIAAGGGRPEPEGAPAPR